MVVNNLGHEMKLHLKIFISLCELFIDSADQWIAFAVREKNTHTYSNNLTLTHTEFCLPDRLKVGWGFFFFWSTGTLEHTKECWF